MPYTTNPKTSAYDPSLPLPQHLDHKPVFAVPYEAFDGHFAGETDVRFVSIGLAQYDPYAVSIKTMRHTGEKWTRQAEELPLHRPIDMTLFLSKVIFDNADGVVTIPKSTFKNQNSEIEITEEERTQGETSAFKEFVAESEPELKKRLNSLRNVLNDLKDRGKI